MSGGTLNRKGHVRNPFSLLVSAELWRAVGFLCTYVIVGAALFAVATTATVLSGVFAMFTLGVPLLVGTAILVRCCAFVERRRAGLFGESIAESYVPVEPEAGVLTNVRRRWSDPALGRDLVYLVLLFPVLFAVDAVVLLIWVYLLAGVLLPFWFWAVTQTWADGTSARGIQVGYLPSGPTGGGPGVWVDDLPTALLMSLAFILVAALAALLIRATARMHQAVAQHFLRPPVDPLAAAKLMLAEPGPLEPFRA